MAVVGIDDSSLKWVGCSLCFCKSVCWMTVGCGGWWVVSSWSWLTAWCSGSARIFFSGGLFLFPSLLFPSSRLSLPPSPLPLPFPPLQARSQHCQNEEADRSSTPFPAFPSPPIPFPPLEVGPLNPARGVWGIDVSSPSGIWGGAPAEIYLHDAF